MGAKYKVLIVGTVPYNVRSTSRAFDAYFHNWEKENLAQIFSHPKKPCKGHCGYFYQITDHAMVKRWFSRGVETGKTYVDEELPIAWDTAEYEVGGGAKKAYKLGARHSSLTHLLRGALWRKKYWCTDALNRWLDDFQPQCVFLAFSNDYFINRIALYVAERYQIPIVSCIGDDYYFNGRFTLNPFTLWYRSTYKALIRKVLRHKGSAVYISDKIRDKYNKEFALDGETVYLNSTAERKAFSPVDKENPVITYFGNVRMGRNNSLVEVATALGQIDEKYRLEVYTNERDEKYLQKLKTHPHIYFGGELPYAEVQKRMKESDITVVVEGFRKKDVDTVRYSLSTKAADALSCGCTVLAYGHKDCGVIQYLESTKAALVCTDKADLKGQMQALFDDEARQKEYYDVGLKIVEAHHTLARSCAVFEGVVEKVMERG